MLNFILADHLKESKNFKRAKNTGYNYSFYFSHKKSEHVRVEAMIGLTKGSNDFMWRFSIFEKGLLSQTFNSMKNEISEVDVWFQNIIIDVYKILESENNKI